MCLAAKVKALCVAVTAGALLCPGVLTAAVPGPDTMVGRNSVWMRQDVNGVDAAGLATRGVMWFDMANEVGAADRLREAVRTQGEQAELSTGERAELERILTVAEVLADYPDAVEAVRGWIGRNQASPHRADMALLLADLLLEQGLTGEAYAGYEAIDIEALSPAVRDDYLYHRAYADLRLANYAAAKSGFGDPELRESAKYGNAARFYDGYISYVDRDYAGAMRAWDTVNTLTMPGCMADFYRAQIAYYEGRYDEAIRLARPLLENGSVKPLFVAEANRVTGESLYQKGDAGAAIPYLKRYVETAEQPERSTMYILGLAGYEEGDYAGAVESLTAVTEDKSAMGQSAYLYIGQALLKTGDDNGAIMAFNRALTMDIDKSVTEAAYYNYAVAKSRGGGVPFASSVTTFEDFLSRFPDSRFADDVAGYIVTGYVTDGNYEAALNSINKVRYPSAAILGAKQKVLYMLGAKKLATDRAAEAVTLLKEAKGLAQFDRNTAAETNLVLGEAYYRTGRYDESAEALLEYLDQAGAGAENRPVALYDLGYTRMAQKEWGKAELDFERVAANPGNMSELTLADVQARLGDARYYQRDWSGAAEAYDAAYRMNPTGGDYPLYQKAVMQGYGRNYAGKLETLDKLTKDFPHSALLPDALMEKAEAYVQLKQPNAANAVYGQLIEDYSGTTQGRRAYLFLASDQAGAGMTDEAIETYESLIEAAPTSEEAQLAAEAVKRLHAERGTLNEYAEFVKQVEGAPSLNTGESETLTWNAAEHAYLGGKGAGLLEKYVREYPTGKYMGKALGYLLDEAEENGKEEDSYRWATMLVDRFPDNAATEQALIVKADIDYENGRGMDALRLWEILETKASAPENANIARLGILRVSRDTGDATRMRQTADALLKSSTLGAEEKTEAAFSRALAMSLEGETAGAITAWRELAENTDDIYGAKAAVYAAEALNGAGRYDESAKVSEAFVNSGTPHTYWLARGFIALSDAYTGQGRQFEAKEYIKALKDNYPGNETDIYDMIEERLK